MISKELLSEVLSNHNIENFEIEDNYLWLQSDGGYLNKNISIYELAHKCKQWALKHGYSLVSGLFIVADDKGDAVFDYFYSCLINYIKNKDREQVLNNFKANTELEAIFKACEWIRTQIAS